MTDYVRDDDANSVVIEFYIVKVVAADLLHRSIIGKEVVVIVFDRVLRQKLALDFVGHLQVNLEVFRSFGGFKQIAFLLLR